MNASVSTSQIESEKTVEVKEKMVVFGESKSKIEEEADILPKIEDLMMYMAAHLRKEKVPLMERRENSTYDQNQWIEYLTLLKEDGRYWTFANLVMQEHGTHLCTVFAKPETKALWIGSRPMWEQIYKNKK